MKKENEVVSEYIIDYDMFDVEEIIKIINFFHIIEKINKGKCNLKKDEVIAKYNEYRNILNNKSLEKQYDKMLEKKNGVSIYHTMKEILG